MVDDARHGTAARRGLRRRRVRRGVGRRCGGTSGAGAVAVGVRARGHRCSPRGSSRRRTRCSSSAPLDDVTAARLENLAAPLASANDQLALVTWFQRAAPPAASVPAPCRGAASSRSDGCPGVPAQIQSDYTFTALVGVFGWTGAWIVTLGCTLWLHRLVARARRASRAASRASFASAARLHADEQAFLGWIAVAWVVLDAVPARGDGRGQPRRHSAHRRDVPVRELRHDVARS